MFLGPWDQGGDWNDDAFNGITRWLNRVWDLCTRDSSEINENSLVDLAGNKNYGIFINDYQIKFNEDNQPIKKKQPTRSKLGKSKKGKSF